MQITELRLKQFRSYQDARFRFDPSITLITGKNGVGKTNLLEAIYVLMQGTSFRAGDGDLIEADKEWWRLDAVFTDNERQVRYQPSHTPAKQLIVHETTKRFTYRDRLPLVLFEPTDLQLIHGSPTRRRDTLDTMLSALSQPYKVALGRYDRALKQRNNILKKQPLNLEDVLFSWDILLSEYGTVIREARYKLVDDINTMLEGYYSEVAGKNYTVRAEYRSELQRETSGSQYIAALHRKLALDRLRSTTSIGPHRDDIDFILEDANAKHTASRGEVRTILLALKTSYAHLLERTYGEKPVVLLDDVFSELDTDRQTNLLSLLRDHQTIITDTKTVPGLTSAHIELG